MADLEALDLTGAWKYRMKMMMAPNLEVGLSLGLHAGVLFSVTTFIVQNISQWMR